jgi:hypothetical protein
MAPLKQKGDLAELRVACDLAERSSIESRSSTPNPAREYLAVYDGVLERCHYIPSELGTGRSVLHLRVEPTQNNQRAGIRFADDYLRFGPESAKARLFEE